MHELSQDLHGDIDPINYLQGENVVCDPRAERGQTFFHIIA